MVDNLYFGFVEDNVDPMKIGRVRVRIVGLHTTNKSDIPTNHLPWYSCILPANVSTSVKAPAIGAQVILTPLDESLQQFLVLGVVPGITEEPDTSRLARNESINETIVQTKHDNKLSGDITEPDPLDTYGAIYPSNFAWQTPGGHVIELDDTTGFERIQIYHQAGSFIEITADGTLTIKADGDMYIINSGTRYESIGAMDQKVIGSEYKIMAPLVTMSGSLQVGTGATGTFSADGNTITVQKGIITNIA